MVETRSATTLNEFVQPSPHDVHGFQKDECQDMALSLPKVIESESMKMAQPWNSQGQITLRRCKQLLILKVLVLGEALLMDRAYLFVDCLKCQNLPFGQL